MAGILRYTAAGDLEGTLGGLVRRGRPGSSSRSCDEPWTARDGALPILSATLVISGLADGPKRYGQLHREVAGATKKMLTQTLRRLQRDGLVSRRVEAGVPPEVEYALTPLGRSILPLQRAIAAWADVHHAQVAAARRTYDARS